MSIPFVESWAGRVERPFFTEVLISPAHEGSFLAARFPEPDPREVAISCVPRRRSNANC